jgi:secreted PhoX family phosphatase
MRSRARRRWAVALPVVALVLATTGVAYAAADFGAFVQNLLRARAHNEFGVSQPLAESSARSITAAEAQANPLALVTLAHSLQAHVVTSTSVAQNIDMIALWPNSERPTHLIACNEAETTDAGLIRVDLKTGQTDVIVTGTTDCDPAHRTPWGAILFGEEAGGGANGGRVYELIDPVHTTNVQLNRATGVFSGGTGAQNLIARPALGRLSFEGLAIFPNGVVYYGDENRPSVGTPGGAYFKFIPTSLRNPSAGPITSLDQSPLTAGSIFGLRLGLRSNGTDYGQGTQTGFGRWVPIPSAPDPDLRAQAAALKLTGYYRPEDIAIDGAALANGNVRWCGNDTGNEDEDQNYGETLCVTDGTLAEAAANTARPEGQYLVIGHPELAMPDNIAYQPDRGNWIIHEDAATTYLRPHNDDLWDCLPDGSDENLLSDGCIRIATLNDLTAEWTGGVFDASGDHFYVSVQHNISGQGLILDITGWR